MVDPKSIRRKRIILTAIVIVFAVVVLSFALKTPMAPEVGFATIKGEKFSTSDLRGKVVLINFWATSCPGCIDEMPRIVDTYRQYQARGFETVAVAMSYDSLNHVLSYAQSKALPFKIAFDSEGEIAKRFGDVQLTPTTFVIDKQGYVIREYLGQPDFNELHLIIEQALKI